MNADNRANPPDSGPALWSYADECLARLAGHLRANTEQEASIARLESMITAYEREYGMTTFTFLRRWHKDEVEDTAEFNKWRIVASALGYDAPIERGPYPYRMNVASTDTAIEIEPGTSVPTTPPTDGGDGTMVDGTANAIENDTDNAQELEAVSSEMQALSVMASTAEIVSSEPPVSPPPSDGGVGDTVYFDRPSRPPGLSKLRGEIWDWIEQHADGRAAANLSATIVRKATTRARGVCAEVLTMYREWPDALKQEAS